MRFTTNAGAVLRIWGAQMLWPAGWGYGACLSRPGKPVGHRTAIVVFYPQERRV